MTELGALRGVVPVLETPFLDDGDLDRRSFRRLVDHLAGTGVTAVMFPGFASEFYKLDDAERHELVATLLAATADTPLTALVSVTDHATRTAVLRARSYRDLGARAVNLLPPRQPVPDGPAVLDHLAAVLDAVDPLPVVLQYAPQQAGAALSPADMAALARAHPNLVAVKVETDQPARLVAALRSGDPSLPALVGNAGRQLLPALRAGAVGVQPGCSLTEVYVRVWDDWAAGRRDEARLLHLRLLDHLMEWGGGAEHIVAVEKLVSHRRGLIATPVCRAPARVLDERDVDAVERCLAEFADLLAGSRQAVPSGARARG